MGQMTEHDQSTNKGTDVLQPRVLSMPEPGKYLLGGNAKLVRNIKDYKAILQQIPKVPKTTLQDPSLFGRRLCGLLMRWEFTKEELATKNVTGISRHSNKQINRIGKLDPVIMEAIFEQAQYQFPRVNFTTDEGGRKMMINFLNNICKKARQNLAKETSYFTI